MANANFNDKSTERISEMHRMSSRLNHELKEIAKEEERQKLLDALSDSQAKNTELEMALAKLAREQDRIALFERERVLKRAQVARATAELVYEANWARNRMESEMRQAKLRAMVFTDPITENVMPTRPSVAEIVSAPPSQGAVTSAGLNKESKNSRRSSSGQSVATTAKLDDGANSNSPPYRSNHLPPFSQSLPTTQANREALPIASDEANSISPTIPDEPGITELVSSAAANVFGSFMESYTAFTNQTDVTPRKPTLPLPATQAFVPSEGAKPAGNSSLSPRSRIASTPPLPDQQRVFAGRLGGAKVGSLLPPRSPSEDTSLKVRKIQNSSKGEWTNPQLLTEAEVTMTMMTQERDEMLWSKKSLLSSIHGLPNDKSNDTNGSPTISSPWIELEELWIQRAVGKVDLLQGTKRPEKVPIDSLIAENAGIDKTVLEAGPEVGTGEKTQESPPQQPAPPLVEPGGPPKKKKNGCVIM